MSDGTTDHNHRARWINLLAKRVSYFFSAISFATLIVANGYGRIVQGEERRNTAPLFFHIMFSACVHFFAAYLAGGNGLFPFYVQWHHSFRYKKCGYLGLYRDEYVGCFCVILPPPCILFLWWKFQYPLLAAIRLHLCLSAGNAFVMLMAAIFRRYAWAEVVFIERQRGEEAAARRHRNINNINI